MPKTDEVLLARARAMRTAQTPPEQKLWMAIRAKRLNGVKFSRQVVIGPYIADFCARAHKYIIELDGDTHDMDSRDTQRTQWLEQQGYRVMRFTNHEIGANLEGVLEAVALALAPAARHAPLPGPLPDGERE